MSHLKRSDHSIPDLRSRKRARSFPVTHHEYYSRTPPAHHAWCRMCSHCTSIGPETTPGWQEEHGQPDITPENSVASRVEDAARAETSKRQTQPDHAPEENARMQQQLSSSHIEDSEDNTNVPSAGKQSVEDCAGPQANAPPTPSLITHSKISSSTQTELSCHGSDPSVLVHNDPNTDNCMHCGQYWRAKPRPEPSRPENPYRTGLTLKIHKHEACPPFGVDYDFDDTTRSEVRDWDWQGRTLVDLCLEHPPGEGKTNREDSRTLQIVQELQVKSGRGAQLVVCRLDNDDQDYVAKIYDPLYYDPRHTRYTYKDVTWEADLHYSREVAAYDELNKFSVCGMFVPKFHGSWTFQIPVSLSTGEKLRDVRMILMERIHGRSMVEFNKNTISESERLITLGRMAHAIELISWFGVRHEPTGPWNVMLCDSETPGEVGRIVIIGFERSVVTLLDNRYWRYGTPEPWPEKPANPLDRWFSGGTRDACFYHYFREWLPESWDSRLRPLQEWMHERWSKDDCFEPPWRELRWCDEEARWED